LVSLEMLMYNERRLIETGGVTFTGSIVAFLKLAGRMSSSPTIIPGRHLINSSLLGANVAAMGAFVTMAPGAPMVAATCLGANTVLSFLKGYTTTSGIGGADMRKSDLLISIWAALTDNSCCYYCFERLFWICPGCRRFHA
jgi:NAD/NADP transhydrogenase beta subunit